MEIAGDSAQRKTAARPRRGSGQVQSLTRALGLLRAIAGTGDGCTLSDLAQRTALPPSTAHRLLTTLESERFVAFDGATGLWRVGLASFLIGSAFQRSRSVTRIARPFLRGLMERSGETANLYVESDGEIVCLDQVESRQTMRAITRVGGRVKMHCSGSGKAMLARLDDQRLGEVLGGIALDAETDHSITSVPALISDLAITRARAYAVDDEENALGLRCVAAAVLNEAAHPVAAISISGPVTRVTHERLAALGELVRGAAAEITREYGGVDGAPAARPGR